MIKNDNFTYFNLLILCMWLQVINKVKVTHQGEGHIKVKIEISTSFSIFMSNFTYFDKLILCVWLQIITVIWSSSYIKVKVTSRLK